MAVRMIRPAKPEDINELLKLRLEYCQQAYKGFDVLCSLQNERETAAGFEQWFADPLIRVSLMYLDDTLTAFSAYRLPKASPGEILDLEYLINASLPDIQALVESILKDMTQMDADYVQVWLLRDNLRARFHYQQFGFKPAGNSREAVVGGTSLQYTKYVYCLKECPPDCI